MDAVPLGGLEELWTWQPKGDTPSIVPLVNYTPQGKDRPQLMLCHDMQGGYLEQESLSGYCVPADSHPYIFLHWWQIDVFCYFSHNFITIPPVGWTNLAHSHGVRVWGTVITEWTGGKAICSELLSTEEKIEKTVEKLVDIARFWNFEGWLINIENKLDEDEVPKMCSFIQKLTDGMKSMSEHAEVVWYDSVTNAGKLDWQNALNEKNRTFYDHCDGIYLNYNWKDEHLEESARHSEKRGRHTVWAGVDCFARGCLGGWDCGKSLSALKPYGFSTALFAPGWIVETMPSEDPISNGRKFWSMMAPFTECRPITHLPFKTNFGIGFVNEAKWWCLGNVSPQPHWSVIDDSVVPLKEEPGLLLPDIATYKLFVFDVTLDSSWEVQVGSSTPVSLILNETVVPPTSPGVFTVSDPIDVRSMHVSTLTTDTVLYSIDIRKKAVGEPSTVV